MLLDQNDTAFVDNVLDEFAAWLQTVGDPYPDDSVANAAVFIDWRRRHFAADLAAFDEDDVVEFLLDWCPRRITMPAEASSWFCASIGALLEFLGNTGRLGGRRQARGRAKQLGHEPRIRHAEHDVRSGQQPESDLESPRFQSAG